MVEIDAGFIGIFKIGDNINYNLQILAELYKVNNESNEYLFNKPITIFIASIIEALLYDFHFKAKYYTLEGIKNITNDVLDYIRSKNIDRLGRYIASARKHKIFKAQDETFYDDLETLSKLRNRIHIQNEKNDLESDESSVFTNDRRILAEKLLEIVMKSMAESHNRDHEYVKKFRLPWNSHADD